jgi:hypothetical protein
MPEPERIDQRRAALIAYDVCRRALAPSDPARRAAMRPVLDAWVQMIAAGWIICANFLDRLGTHRGGLDVTVPVSKEEN